MILKKRFLTTIIMTLTLGMNCFSQTTCSIPNQNNRPTPVFPVPSKAQQAWQEMEMYAFIHFGMNTFTDVEWGDGSEQPSRYAPKQALDVNQWVTVCKEAGLKGIILTAKHHDGFCIWNTQSTAHSTAQCSGYGKDDVVKLLSDECAKQGLKFGVYVSPWDRNNAEYGRPGYLDVYRKQIRELCTNYGNLFELWFDGANGGSGYYGGTGGTRTIDASTYYDWPNTIEIIKSLQPNTVIWGIADEARWIGNELGYANETNWCTEYGGSITNAVSGNINGGDWIPGECDVSIRSNWFYHAVNTPKTGEALFDIYIKSVGRNANLILNIPPNTAGRFADADVAALKSWKALMNSNLGADLALSATATASAVRSSGSSGVPLYTAAKVNDGDKDSFWAQEDGTTTASVVLSWNSAQTVKYIMLQEYIRLGQRVKAFEVDIWNGSSWETKLTGTTIGYKRILPFPSAITTTKVRVRITDSKVAPLIHTISVF
ncbi:alpha-L-fucosidase [uncultured Bacteroides sp.]|uniref:alpha-L-fucosidase n=1 Tax=uncultured Bacteroides sp. TaxID=162156 RepID=UPI002AABC411|nr:alpha-L-fucosidase [uncultured Bacteroides sp.]